MDRFRFRLLLSLLLVVLALAGCAKGSTALPTAAPTDTRTTPAPAPTSAEAVGTGGVLRVNEGDEVTYHTTIKGAFSSRIGSGQAKPATAPMGGTTAQEFDTKLHVDKVVGNEVTVSYSMSGFTGSTVMGGQVTTNPSIADKHYTMKIDSNTGRLIDLDLGSELDGAAKDQLMKILDRTFAQFPTGTKFAPGSAWTMDLSQPLPVPGIQGESKVTATTRYEADETRNGVRVARLVTTGSGPVSIQGEADGVIVSAKGTIEMSAVQYLDLKTGLQHSLENHWVFKFTQSMKEAQSGTTVMEAEVESTSEVTMVRK